MRLRAILICSALALGIVPTAPANAALPIVLAAGPLQPPGIFSEEGMHPIFTACSFPTLDTVTSTTNVLFEIRHDAHDAYFQITNSCGTYDELFNLAECDRDTNGTWVCDHIRADGFRAYVSYGEFDGRRYIGATEYKDNPLRYWSVNGAVSISAE